MWWAAESRANAMFEQRALDNCFRCRAAQLRRLPSTSLHADYRTMRQP